MITVVGFINNETTSGGTEVLINTTWKLTVDGNDLVTSWYNGATWVEVSRTAPPE